MKGTNISNDIQLVFMGIDDSLIGNFKPADKRTYKKRMSKYNLVQNKVYNVHCMGDIRWVDKSTNNEMMEEIDKDLVNMFFKPLSEIRDDKISAILK